MSQRSAELTSGLPYFWRRYCIKTDTGIENDAESMAAQIGLIKSIKNYDLKRVISFHNRVSRAKSFKNDVHQASGTQLDRRRASPQR